VWGVLESVGDNVPYAEKEEAVRDEAMAITEAVHALRRLASDEVGNELREFVRESEPECLPSHMPGNDGANPPGGRAKEELQSFLDHGPGKHVVLKRRHAARTLNSFDEDFWCHCFVDLFFRAKIHECQPAYMFEWSNWPGTRWMVTCHSIQKSVRLQSGPAKSFVILAPCIN
jgi:hypothetical protein